MLALGSIDAVEAMIDEVNPVYEGELRDRFEIAIENDGAFTRGRLEGFIRVALLQTGKGSGERLYRLNSISLTTSWS